MRMGKPRIWISPPQDVEEAHLDPRGEVGQLVHAEDAAIGPGQDSEVNHLGSAKVNASWRLDRVTSRSGRRRSRREWRASPGSAPPGGSADGELVPQLRCPLDGGYGHWRERVLVHLRSVDGGDPLVHQRREGARDTSLRLSAEPRRMKLFPESRHSPTGARRCPVSDDARKDRLAVLEPLDQVGAELRVDASGSIAALTEAPRVVGLSWGPR